MAELPDGGVAVTVTVYGAELVVAVVAMVKTDVTAAVPVTETDAGAALHVGRLTAPDGPVTAQVSATAPVNPPAGVTVRVDVALLPAATLAGLAAVAVRAKLIAEPVPVTVTAVEGLEAA